MFNKKFSILFLSISLLTTLSFPAHALNNSDPRLLGLNASGFALVAGGIYWIVKNPTKKEGIIKRTFRTGCGCIVVASGLVLIFNSKTLLEKIDKDRLESSLHNLYQQVQGFFRN